MTVVSCQSSSRTLQEESILSYEPITYDNPSDEAEWNDCDIPIWALDKQQVEVETSDRTQNPFVFGGAIPASAKPKNVVLFGEAGVGKSSVINLMAGKEVAPTSPNLDGCTLHATEYSFVLSGGTCFRIYDTVGLNEPHMGVNTFFGAVEKAHRLVASLHAAGGIDLLIFCIRGGRITATMQRNYRLFFEILSGKKVPLAFVVTHLENESRMEDWWVRNARTFCEYDMGSVAHACVTAVPARMSALEERRQESRTALEKLLRDAFKNARLPYVRDVQGWFACLLEFVRSILMKSSWLKKKDLSRRLENRCNLSPDEARRLAETLARDS